MTATLQDFCDPIIKHLIEGIGDATGGWAAPWTRMGHDVLSPVNVETGKHYQGGNVWSLAFSAMDAEYPTGVWGTFKQWKAKGAAVKKGEHGTMCVRWVVAPPKTTTDENGDEIVDERGRRIFPRFFYVFNAAQVDGWEAPTVELLDESARIERIERFLLAQGASVHHGGDRAFYRRTDDTIHLPMFGAFRSPVDYYSTSAHEHAHRTGHETRLNRTFGGRFGDEDYAFEELVAEMTSALTLARFGLSTIPRPDHAQYLASWVKVLTDQPKALITAAGLASKALGYMLDIADIGEGDGDDTPPPDPEPEPPKPKARKPKAAKPKAEKPKATVHSLDKARADAAKVAARLNPNGHVPTWPTPHEVGRVEHSPEWTAWYKELKGMFEARKRPSMKTIDKMYLKSMVGPGADKLAKKVA